MERHKLFSAAGFVIEVFREEDDGYLFVAK